MFGRKRREIGQFSPDSNGTPSCLIRTAVPMFPFGALRASSDPPAAFRPLLLLLTLQLAELLRCFSGDPAFKNECTSLSYCLMIISRNGRTQWSCDGNAFSQVSLCSTLGLQQDVEEANANYPPIPKSSRLSVNADPLVRTPFDASGSSALSASSSSSNRYYPPSSRTKPTYRERDLVSRRFGPTAVMEGLRCFDAGLLGRVCCCSDNFCNAAPPSREVPSLPWAFLLLIGVWRIIGFF
ncbi:hypothetical protein M3Y99_01405100 [Aphelenchoides fujianensis]|nr:hypothetical protein M3Y99_01405100 [Aphelenchoides fujianensis]